MSKNISRTLIVIVSCIIAIWTYEKLDKLLAVTGALTCTPIAFTLPALFHLKVCAESTKDKVIDWIIIVFSVAIMLYCGTTAIMSFAHAD